MISREWNIQRTAKEMDPDNKNRLEERIYAAESTLLQPSKLALDMWSDLCSSRELAWRLMVKEISAQYRQSFLGIAWAFIPPIVLTIALVVARSSQVINIQETSVPYVAYVVIGMLLWQTFAESFMAPMVGLQQSRQMLAKIKFPYESIMLAKAGEVLFNFAIKAILILIMCVWFELYPDVSFLLFPVSLASLILLGFSLGMFLAPVGALYTDVSKGMNIIMGFWMLMTPVLYPVPINGWFSVIVNLNPVTDVLVTTRQLITAQPVTDWTGFLAVFSISCVVMIIAWLIFRAAMPYVIERMSA